MNLRGYQKYRKSKPPKFVRELRAPGDVSISRMVGGVLRLVRVVSVKGKK